MNVAKKSTTKLPQSWQQGINVQLEEAKDEEADSGVGSADSVDFQDALLNLKALNGASGSVPECESNQSKVNELQCKQTDHPTACETFKGDLESLSPIKDSKGEKDILEQIDDIVNDTVPGEKVVANGVAAGKPVTSKLDAETEEDDVLILNPDDNYETKKDGKLLELSILKGKTLPGNGAQMRNPLKIGDKVRSKVHTIMSKFVQNNPVVNSLLAKAKSVDSEESDGSGAGTGVASPLPVRPGKGNLFDNFDITLTDRENKSPQVTSDTISGNKCISPPLMASNDIETSPVERLHDETNKKPAAETSCSEPAATVLQPDIGSLSQTLKESANSVGETERTESDKCAVDPEGTKDVLLDSRTDLMDTKTTQDKTECTITDSTVQKETECKNKAYKDSECESDAAPPLKPVSGSCAGQEDQTINNTITNTECQKAECRKEVDSAPDETMDTSENATSSSVGECDELTKESAEGKEDTPLCHQVTDRKRQHSQDPLVLDNDDTKDTVPQVPKRSRLDGLIGKLGERVAFTSDAPDNDAFEDDDSTPGDIDSVEKQSQEPISGSASEDEEEKTSSSDSGAKITLTRKDLEQLIIMSATAAIQQHQSQEILQLNRRVEELTQASDEWRTKAKELQNQMLELTVLQQKLDKRKAHTAALKSITTRSIGVGVTEDRLRTTTPQKATGNKTPPATPPANGQTPLSWPVATNPPTLRLPALTPAVTQSMAARNTSVAHLLSQTAHMPTVASCQAAAAKAAVGKPVDTSGQVPGAISLNHTGSTRVPSVAAVSSNNMVLVNSTTGLPMVKTKTSNTILKAASRDLIDLTMEDDAGGTKQAGKQEQYVLLWDCSKKQPSYLVLPNQAQLERLLPKPGHSSSTHSLLGIKPQPTESLSLVQPQPVGGISRGSVGKCNSQDPPCLVLPSSGASDTGCQGLAESSAIITAGHDGSSSDSCNENKLRIDLRDSDSSRNSSISEDDLDDEDESIDDDDDDDDDEEDETEPHDSEKMYIVIPQTSKSNDGSARKRNSGRVTVRCGKKARHNEPLNQHAVFIMHQWYSQHKLNPYPSKVDKEKMAREGGITPAQVKAWFANKRNRSNNTRPKMQKRILEEKLLQLYAHVAAKGDSELGNVDGDKSYIIGQLSEIIKPIINPRLAGE